MDALGTYGSDSDDDDVDDASDHKAAATTTTNPTTATTSSSLLPAPQTDGAASWILGESKNYLEDLMKSAEAAKSPDKKNPAATTTAFPSFSSPTTGLAQEIRSHKEFSNPHHLDETVETLGIADPWGTSVVDGGVVDFAAWEYNLVQLEEQARQNAAAAPAVPASDFVQEQISRALGRSTS